MVSEENSDGVNFVLMLKKNNKQVLKGLSIPLTSDLAANIRNKQLAERAEHEEMKKLVLDYNQRQEEESYNGMKYFRLIVNVLEVLPSVVYLPVHRYHARVRLCLPVCRLACRSVSVVMLTKPTKQTQTDRHVCLLVFLYVCLFVFVNIMSYATTGDQNMFTCVCRCCC